VHPARTGGTQQLHNVQVALLPAKNNLINGVWPNKARPKTLPVANAGSGSRFLGFLLVRIEVHLGAGLRGRAGLHLDVLHGSDTLFQSENSM